MAINLPGIGQVDWGGDLNSALRTLDEQTVIDIDREGDDLVLVKNSGDRENLGDFRGAPGDPGPPGDQGPPGANATDGDIAGLVSNGPETRAAILEFNQETYATVSMDEYPGADDTAKLQAAIDAAVAAKEDRTIQVPRAITIDRTITWDAGYVSLEFHNSPVRSTVAGAPTFHVLNSRTGLTANVNKSFSGIELRGPGRAVGGSLAFRFDSNSASGNARGVAFYNCEIRNFETSVLISNNAYLISFFNCHFWGYEVGIDMPVPASNYGENIRFIGSTFGSGGLAVRNYNADGDIYLSGCSVDFVGKVAEARNGFISFNQCHIELRHSDVSAPIMSTHGSRSQIFVSNSRLMLHDGTVSASYMFHTEGNDTGLGISITDTETFCLKSSTGILCSGTGKLYTRNVRTMDSGGSGATNESVITSAANNRLIDPEFGATLGYATVRDAFISSSGASDRVTSPSMRLDQISPGRLRVIRPSDATGSDTAVRVVVPLTGDLSHEWASGFRLTAGPAVGTFTYVEGFMRADTVDSLQRPVSVRQDTRSVSTITLPESYPFSRYYGYTSWDRHERPWANYFFIQFNFSGVPSGVINFSDINIGCR